jgi:uncharacterized protein
VDLEAVTTLARAALQNLEAHRQRIDDLNVYPVPDGDTGTNLTLTLRSIVEALEATSPGASMPAMTILSRAALLGARGNSGVIFSQIVRGFADVLGEEPGAPTSARLARALREASNAAYRAVREPVEGTMLTVIREMADEGETRHDLSPAEFLEVVVARGEDAVERTPQLLDVLRDAGVVDAGGAGLVEIARGLALAAAGKPVPEAPVESVPLGFDAIHQELSRYRYCTGFVVEGDGLDADALEQTLEPLGDSLLVVGDPSALKVHVHTDDPGAALSAGTAMGIIGRVEIADMHVQTFEREGRLLGAGTSVPALETGVVVVCQGEGNRRLFKELGATTVIEGGQTMNPSAAELVEAILATPADEVIVLPNNANVILTAEQAAALADKPVRVVPSRSVQAGFASIGRYVSTNSPEENEAAMRDTLSSATTGEVTVASRDAELDGVSIREGAYLGLVDGTAVAAGDDIETVTLEVIDRVLQGERSWLGILTGEHAPSLDGLLEAIERAHPEVEDVEVHEGGQPHYPLLVVAD